jgi:hypothetical protein
MYASRVRAAALAVAATVGLSACTTGLGYGSGVSVGMGNGYYDPYYGGGYRSGYGYGPGYGYNDPRYGYGYGYYPGYGYGYGQPRDWYGGYYYPGSGYYVYDRYGRRYRVEPRRDGDRGDGKGWFERVIEDGMIKRGDSTGATTTQRVRSEPVTTRTVQRAPRAERPIRSERQVTRSAPQRSLGDVAREIRNRRRTPTN